MNCTYPSVVFSSAGAQGAYGNLIDTDTCEIVRDESQNVQHGPIISSTCSLCHATLCGLQIWILYFRESPYNYHTLHPEYNDAFNWTATYRRDSDLVTPHGRWVYYDSRVKQRPISEVPNYAANKTRKVRPRTCAVPGAVLSTQEWLRPRRNSRG